MRMFECWLGRNMEAYIDDMEDKKKEKNISICKPKLGLDPRTNTYIFS